MFTRKASAAALAILATLGMSVISGIAHADETGRRVTGGGQYTSSRVGPTTVAVHAIRHQDGTVTGQIEQHILDFGLSVHGEVNCLFVVGNVAYVSGVITNVQEASETGLGSFFQEGTFFLLAIEDNGEGLNSFGSDRVSLLFPSATPFDCENPPALASFMNDLTQGNFQVVP